METRANFILIGLFTLLGILGMLGFFIWLANVQLERQYRLYGILFEDVSGLDASGDVLFNGIPVGSVIGLQIFDEDPAKVLATIEIDATTPVRENTVAQLMSQGVTGVAYISLSGGPGDAPPLTAAEGELPIIPSRRSTVQGLVEDAPDLMAQANALLGQLQELVSAENRTHVTGILRNVEASSANLDAALTEFSDVARTVRDASDQIASFTARLDSIGESVTTTLSNTDTALNSAAGAFDEVKVTVEAARPAIGSAAKAFDSAAVLMRDRVPAIADQLAQTLGALDTAVRDVAAGSTAALDGFGQTAELLNSRLVEVERTVDAADTAFAAVTEASDSLKTLTTGDAAQLVADAREALAGIGPALTAIQTTAERDLPAVVAHIRAAVTAGSEAIDRVAADLTGFTQGLAPLTTDAQAAIAGATQLLDRAGTTLSAMERSLSLADGALTGATTAFETANALMDTDLAPVLGDIRSASASIDAAATQLATDLPAITTDLRALIARGDTVMGQLQEAVAATGPGLSNFATTGLPELSRLGAEARGLVRALSDVVRSLERDPARFLLQDRVPEYRR
ncbi:MlaD family protein [uncultured Paracoccus sp.]|uniref:MlaD family protein n=1 Tax=uncultured Paracoccus sp. TaxID=189685 RepID=UPI00261F5F69|nr:MlaD family protein [uncultured Paracoccus sp.]